METGGALAQAAQAIGFAALALAVAAAALRLAAPPAFRRLAARIRDSVFEADPRADRALALVARKAAKTGALVEGSGLWVARPLHQPPDYAADVAASRVLAVGNLKGGVGKTTLTANLGAYLAEHLERPVLMVDLDFQGSLSSLAADGGTWLPSPGRDSLASALVSGDVGSAEIVEAPLMAVRQGGEAEPRLRIVPAYYELAQAENRITLEWLLSDPSDPTEDVRYRLARVLNAPAVREHYACILIDCPPRLTVTHIQALCAASHLMIPTIFDKLSAEAVLAYGHEVEHLRRSLCPNLQYLCVAGSVWNGDRNRNEEAVRDEVAERLKRAEIDGGLGGRVGLAPEETFFRDLVWFKSENIAYATQPRGAREANAWRPVEALGRLVIERMGLQ